jgi:hypothetical protein
VSERTGVELGQFGIGLERNGKKSRRLESVGSDSSDRRGDAGPNGRTKTGQLSDRNGFARMVEPAARAVRSGARRFEIGAAAEAGGLASVVVAFDLNPDDGCGTRWRVRPQPPLGLRGIH